MKKTLEGIRVLDLTTFMSGPFASMVLGDLGAEVIKIEEPGNGDASRQIPPYFHEGESLYYVSLNRNKKSVTLNLNSEPGKKIFYDLVKKADIVIENYRPGVTKKLGVDYERLKAINPRIIYSSITAYGPEGPYGQRPAYDLIIQALSGSMSMTGEEGTGPLRLGVPMGDLAGSMWALVGTLAALQHRERTGEGQFVDISLLDALTSLITYPALYFSYGGEVAQPLGSGHQAIVPFQAFKTKDYYLAITCANEKFWGLLCKALEMPELAADPRFVKMGDRLKNKEALNALLNEVFSRKTNAEWEAVLSKAGVPCAPVNTIDKVFADPALQYRGMVISVDHFGKALRFFGNPVKMSSTPINEYGTPPRLGADNQEVLGKYLGLSPDDVARLKKEGTL
ncbi:MAG: CoA transferase [Deltaproteobacteria bacterium]|nr:CoA transferase [Deltaproteobacteria bacterium]